MKTLIAYFSHVGECLENDQIVTIEKGNTEKVAEKIKELTGADLYKIEEAEPYPFNYDDCLRRARKEDENNEHPVLKDVIGIDINQYDVIYLGFPIWYRTYPRVIASFIDKYNFTGKTIKPFCTNDEGTFGITLLELESQLKGVNILDGLSIRGVDVDNSMDKVVNFVNK